MNRPRDFIKFKYRSARASISIIDNHIGLLGSVHAQERRKGHASGLMQQVVDYADQQGLQLRLVVQRYGHPAETMDNHQLESFYGRFGFLRDPESSRPVTMTREAREKNEASNDTQPSLKGDSNG
jgi:GNAT superfamily N-acetyltransferase